MKMVIHSRSGSDKTAHASAGNISTSNPNGSGTKDKARILKGTVDHDGVCGEQDDDAEPPPPSSSPASEDDRQYMMLRHSDDDDDDDDKNQQNNNKNYIHANESGQKDAVDAVAAATDAATAAGGVTTIEDSKLSIVSPVADNASRAAAAAIRRQRRQLAGVPPQPAPATMIRQVSHYPPNYPMPQPFPFSPPQRHHVHYQDHHHQQQQVGGYYNYYEGEGRHHGMLYSNEQQQQQHHQETARDEEFIFPHATSLSAAPSWGSSTNDSSILLTRRMGTFDYGDVNSMVAVSAGDTASPNTALLGEGPTMTLGEGSAFSKSISSSATTNVITPAQIARKSSLMFSQQEQHQQSHNHHYLYPPSSPIRASSLGEREQEESRNGRKTSGGRPSPNVEDDVNDDDKRVANDDKDPSSSSSSSSKRKMNNSKGDEEVQIHAGHQKNALPLDEEEGEDEEELAAEWLPPRRGSGCGGGGGGGGGSLVSGSGTKREIHSQDGTRRPSRPPPFPTAKSSGVEEGAFGSAVSTVGSPSSPPIPSGGRVQLVGGEYENRHNNHHHHHQYRPQVVWRDNSWEGDNHPPPPPRQLDSASPWSVVSRSRSAESHGSSGLGTGSNGGNSEWDPPRPTRHPMVPPPGRPSSIMVGDRRSLPPPPPPSSSSHYGEPTHYPIANVPYLPPPTSPYYAWGGGGEYYGGGGVGRDTRMMPPPPPPSIQKSSSSLSSVSASGGGGAYSPPQRRGAGGRGQNDTPSTPSSTLAYLPHPSSAAVGVKLGVSGYPPPPIPPSSYHTPSSYPPPPHVSSYLHHPSAQYYPQYPPPPPQHHYYPHPQGAGGGPYRPYPQPHLPPSHHQDSSLIAAKESPQDPTAHPLLRDYNPNQDGFIRPQFRYVKKVKTPSKTTTTTVAAAAASSSAVAAALAEAVGGDTPENKNESASDGIAIQSEDIGGQSSLSTAITAAAMTPPTRRRRRRNPTEKAALAARMAEAAAASLRERNAKRVDAGSTYATLTGASRPTKKNKAEGSVIHDEKVVEDDEVGNDDVSVGGEGGTEAIGTGGLKLDEASPFSEEELKILGSGDDEDIPAARRAAMASALALRAAAGGSPVEPPKSASEVDFDIADPPMLPIVPPSTVPALSSATLMTENDVLCGRGGGTNSQTGNRRYRALVRDFQPTYLMAKRREKPLMARSVVLIVRHRGGRFLRRDDTDGRLYEVGDEKAEAKTSQALREGLDVRATKSAANTLMSSCGSGSGGDVTADGSKKRGSVPNASHVVIVKDGYKEKKDGSTASRLSHPTPGYGLVPPQQAGPRGGGRIRPPYLGGYSDAYYQSRYPVFEHRGPPIGHPPAPRSLHPPANPTIHHHPQYFGGGVGDTARGGYHYPIPFGGYVEPRAAVYPPSPPRSFSSKEEAIITPLTKLHR